MAAGDARTLPDPSYYPSTSLVEELDVGTELVRIFNYKSARRNHYKGFTYNPRRILELDNLPTTRGRFTPIERPPLFDSLYCSTWIDDLTVAILETIDYKTIPLLRAGEFRTIRRSDVLNLAVAYYKLTKPIRLVDFTDKPRCTDWYGANQVHLDGDDNQITREWARWVHTNVPHADGILYQSHQYGSSQRGYPLVLLGNRNAGDCTYLKRSRAMVPLGSDRGYEILRESATRSRIMPESPWR